MARYFISQPMRNETEENIIREREAIADIVRKYDPEAEIVAMFDADFIKNKTALTCLGLSIAELGKCDLAIFAKDWWVARGCFLEHACCKEYDIPHVDLVVKASSKENGAVDTMIRHAICDTKMHRQQIDKEN